VKIVGDEIKFIKLSESDLINNVMEQGFFEGHVLETAANVMRGLTSGTILDIGANMGSFTVPLAYYNPQFSFVAFEPQRMVYNQLCGNLAINYLSNVSTVNLGLGSESKTIVVQVPDYKNEANIGAFSLDEEVKAHEDYLCKTKGTYEEISIRTLDSFFLQGIKLIKIDVEGMELDVIKGGIATIKNNKYPPILFEAWESKEWFKPRRAELIKYLEDLGYEVQSGGEDNLAIYKGESK